MRNADCMPDDKSLRGEPDRLRSSANEEWELEYLIDQTGATYQEIEDAVRAVGNNRDRIEEYLRNKRVF
jgi:hypothetical protein